MPISHAKGKSLATSLLFPGRQTPFLLSLDCLHLGSTQTKRTLHAGAEGSLSYLQTCRIQFIPPQEVKQEWFLAIGHSFRTSSRLNPWEVEVGFETSDEASSDWSHSMCAWGLRLPSEAVQGGGNEWRLLGQRNLVLSPNAASYQLSHQRQITKPQPSCL